MRCVDGQNIVGWCLVCLLSIQWKRLCGLLGVLQWNSSWLDILLAMYELNIELKYTGLFEKVHLGQATSLPLEARLHRTGKVGRGLGRALCRFDQFVFSQSLSPRSDQLCEMPIFRHFESSYDQFLTNFVKYPFQIIAWPVFDQFPWNNSEYDQYVTERFSLLNKKYETHVFILIPTCKILQNMVLIGSAY